jgi:hypothetical protein
MLPLHIQSGEESVMGGSPSRVGVIGPLVPYVDGFRAELEAQGYRGTRRAISCVSWPTSADGWKPMV